MALKFDRFPLSPCALVAIFIVLCFSHVKSSALPTGCPVKYNSTSPTGYFMYYNYFTSRKPAISKGIVTGVGGQENLTTQCFQKCKGSPYGFYLRGFAPFPNPITCYCIMGKLDYSVAESINGVTFIKKCPIIKGCRVAYDSLNPTGYFLFDFYNIPIGFPIYITNSTQGVDVWPINQAALRCSKICKKLRNGFYITSDKYAFNVNCYCLKSPLTYELIGRSIETSQFIFSRACPSKT